MGEPAGYTDMGVFGPGIGPRTSALGIGPAARRYADQAPLSTVFTICRPRARVIVTGFISQTNGPRGNLTISVLVLPLIKQVSGSAQRLLGARWCEEFGSRHSSTRRHLAYVYSYSYSYGYGYVLQDEEDQTSWATPETP